MLIGKTQNHWEKHAQQWELVGPPLRPSTPDTDCFTRIVEEWSASNSQDSLAALLLGVTPEIAHMGWPLNTRLFAADYSAEMIRSLWAMQDQQDRLAFCSDWCTLPLPDDSVRIVIGEGCFTLLSYPDGYQDLAREIRRVLQDDGLLIVRFFVSLDDTASPEQVHEQLLAGTIGNFHIFKFRLAIALQQTVSEGVCVGDVWENWNTQGYDINRLAAKLNWQPETIGTIDAYRGMNARYTYPTLEELETTLSPWFDQVARYNHDYEFGKNCPTLVMRPCGC
jgi:SAM-dependent methyltransferase